MMPHDRRLRLTLVAIVTALAGLIVVQVLLLKDAFALKQEAFRQSVAGALSAAAVRLATGETVRIVQEMDPVVPGHPRTGTVAWTVSATDTATGTTRHGGDTAMTRTATPQRVSLRVMTTAETDSVLTGSTGSARRHRPDSVTSAPTRNGTGYSYETDRYRTVLRFEGENPQTVMTYVGDDRQKQVFVSRVIDNLRGSSKRPIEERISRGALDSALQRSFADAGITLGFSSGVMDRTDSVHLAQPAASAADLRTSPYRTALFLDDGPGNRLVVTFPGQRLYLLQQLWPVLLASVGFLSLILAGFAAGFRIIVRQHQLADSMVEFINNMTHEFKTPLSTVALATEAIRRPDVIDRKTKVLQYNRMIAEEAHRMKGQVDRILNLAQLEEGDAELQPASVDVHQLIEEAAEGFGMHVESRGGRITLDLRATKTVVDGDRVHLLNIIHSLLDNANKYSPGPPAIVIATENSSGRVVVRISDQGKGIPEEFQERVFEKYYRVPTGNLHEVKGFGIGLSYVKRIVELHGGAVSLRSRAGAGTSVTLSIPLAGSPGEKR